MTSTPDLRALVERLEDCPLCGGESRADFQSASGKIVDWIVRCAGCGLQSAWRPSYEATLKAWNTRPTLTTLQHRVAEMEEVNATLRQRIAVMEIEAGGVRLESGSESVSIHDIAARSTLKDRGEGR